MKAPCRMKNDNPLVVHDSRKANRVMSYIIPPLLVLTAVFSTYVWFDMCIQWYLKNGYRVTGICLLTFQVLLLILMGSAFFQITCTRAGYLPNRADRARLAAADGGETGGWSGGYPSGTSGEDQIYKTYDRRPTKNETRAFVQMRRLEDAPYFIARTDSITSPRYCSICDVNKYDRVHHCSEVNRCVKKFDHFCPWVGGPLGHSRYKFFFQFVTYVAIYCIFMAITFGVAVSQRRRATRKSGNIEHIPANPGLWYTCIAISSFFALLMVPFSGFHGRQIAVNKSTVESVEARAIQVSVAVEIVDHAGHIRMDRSRVTLDAGQNPFDLGWWQNWQQVMGVVIFDRWFIFRLLNWVIPLQGR